MFNLIFAFFKRTYWFNTCYTISFQIQCFLRNWSFDFFFLLLFLISLLSTLLFFLFVSLCLLNSWHLHNSCVLKDLNEIRLVKFYVGTALIYSLCTKDCTKQDFFIQKYLVVVLTVVDLVQELIVKSTFVDVQVWILEDFLKSRCVGLIIFS